MPEMENWPNARLLSTAARLLENAWNEKLRGMGLTHAGVVALDVLAAMGPVTQATLAQVVRVQAQTMGRILPRLEAHGHISRVRSLSDRRRQVVAITDKGSAALVQAHELERLMLPAVVEPDKLRSELITLVHDLATRYATPAVDTIAAAGTRIYQRAP